MTEKHQCEERLMGGRSEQYGIRNCKRNGVVFEHGKWKCNIHSDEGKARRQAASDAKFDQWLKDRRKVNDARAETARRAACYDELVGALKTTAVQLDSLNRAYRTPTTTAALETARAALRKAGEL
jgi:hypothetical protein